MYPYHGGQLRTLQRVPGCRVCSDTPRCPANIVPCPHPSPWREEPKGFVFWLRRRCLIPVVAKRPLCTAVAIECALQNRKRSVGLAAQLEGLSTARKGRLWF